MTSFPAIRIYVLATVLVILSQPLIAVSQTAKAPDNRQTEMRDGQHDFDFNFGTWRTHIKRLRSPLTNSREWIESSGTVVVSKIWNGRANLEEINIDGPTGHLEGLTLRLYHPESRQWYFHWASSNDGTLSPAMVGEFKNGIGEFYDQETFKGRAIFARQIYSEITSNSYHFEQAFSDDGGKTWEPNWIATLNRELDKQGTQSHGAKEDNHQHDFDFNFGSWQTHVSRLTHPLTASKIWVEYDGLSVVRKVWGGRASLLELEVDGPAGHIQGMGLRLYNSESHRWSLNWASSVDGIMNQPMIGEFKNERGEFFDQEPFNGRTIFARNGFLDITPNSSRFEQAFSDDGGKTWETNWVMTFKR